MEASSGVNWPSFVVQLCHEVFLKALVRRNHTVLVVTTKQDLLKTLKSIIVTNLYLGITLAFIIIFFVFFWRMSDFCDNFLILKQACIFHVTLQPICDFFDPTVFKTWQHAKNV
ncbi:hypothetical protein AVEN_26-1 [Araneus ventricosus]|uniref:Uncharacterized protein n=1 Tax=Araneus ventricosus TaxID=182803 RepID=A0A4Y2RIM1_ARAVE|nr:hypothetical protein AVEN_26-1 [Araneus ventricosus]